MSLVALNADVDAAFVERGDEPRKLLRVAEMQRCEVATSFDLLDDGMEAGHAAVQ